MSTDYVLKLDTNSTPEQVIELLSRRPGLMPEDGGLYGLGLLISCMHVDKVGRNIAEEAWGILPTVSVCFRCNELATNLPEDADPQEEEVVGRSIVMMTHLQSDAVLLLNGEITVMLYRGGELTLNSDFKGFWTVPDRLAWVTIPYTIESVPSL
jgi:hypothetical protein